MGYPGGKSGPGVYHSIINLMPPHRVYCEPFLGGGGVMRMKLPALENIGVDLDAGAVRQMRRWSTHQVASMRLARRDRARASADIVTPGDYAGGLEFLTGSEIAETGEGARSRRVDPAFRFDVGSAFDFLVSREFADDELVYCDPPYMHETRGRSDLYKFELSDSDHAKLLRILKRLPCLVMVSGYRSPLYARELQNWNCQTFQATNRAGGVATEQIWFNFREPLVLHDYRFLGKNFRERERIKRKKSRWVSRLQAMPILERRALIAAMRDAWSGGRS